MKSKYENVEQFEEFKQSAKVQSRHKLICLQSNNGGECTSKSFQNFCIKNDVRRHLNQAHTPAQNGIAKGMNRSLSYVARCLTIGTTVPKILLPEAISTTTYLLNIRPTSKIQFKTLERLFLTKRLSLKHLRIFGTTTYIFIH